MRSLGADSLFLDIRPDAFRVFLECADIDIFEAVEGLGGADDGDLAGDGLTTVSGAVIIVRLGDAGLGR